MLSRIAYVLAALASACSTESTPPLAPTHSRAQASTQQHQNASESADEVSSAADSPSADAAELLPFATEIAEYKHALDMFESAIVHPAAVPKRFVAARLDRKLRGRLDKLQFQRAAGYLYWNDLAPWPSFNYPGCRFGVLTKDGVPCPSALVPPIELSPEAAHELLESVSNEAVPSVPKVCMCGGKRGPMHSFVFYDEHDTPVATITLNLDYHDLQTAPDDGHGRSGYSHTSEQFRSWYQRFCEASGMPLCMFWDDERHRAFSKLVRDHDIGGPERSPLELIADRPLDELDQHSRRILCALAHKRSVRIPSTSPHDVFGRESDSGEVWFGRAIPWWECERQFPSCKDKLSVVWPCTLAAVEGDPGFFEPEVSQCKAHAQCIWGFADQWRGTRAEREAETKGRKAAPP